MSVLTPMSTPDAVLRAVVLVSAILATWTARPKGRLAWAQWGGLVLATAMGVLLLPTPALGWFCALWAAVTAYLLESVRTRLGRPEREFVVFDLLAPITSNTSRRIDRNEFIDRHSTMVLYIPQGVEPAGLSPEVKAFLEQSRIAPGLYSLLLDNHALHIIDSAGLYAYILSGSNGPAVEDFAQLLNQSESGASLGASSAAASTQTPPASTSPPAGGSAIYSGPVPVQQNEDGSMRLGSFGSPSTPPSPPSPSP